VLAAIDGALDDGSVSVDAMRWSPDPARAPRLPAPSPPRLVELIVRIDMGPLVEAMRHVGEVIRVAAAQLAAQLAAYKRHTARSDRAAARKAEGGVGDLFGDWQSSACAAWLHDSCRDPGLTGCGCTHHGGKLR
jgi:hypothetical protein